MHRVLLCCKSADDARFVKGYIETELPYEVLTALDPSEIQGILKSKNIHLLIMQTGNLVKEDLSYAMSLRTEGFAYPILMISDSVANLNIEELHDRYKIYFIDRPFEMKTLKGLSRKLMVAKTVPQQVYRRFNTNFEATLQTFVSGDQFATRMFNLSRGGAYFELPKKPGVTIGDLLRVKVHLSEMSKERQLHGRVVWMTHKGHSAGGYGMGVKFIKSDDVYSNLLEKV
jgi:Tfp pilus assembly protein PilZ